MKEGVEKGMKEGKKEGRKEMKQEMLDLLKSGISPEEIIRNYT
jgi:flagellar biosynthesis/type III secretory pathway protein FliH